MLNTGFVFDDVQRVYKKDIDYSKSIELSKDFYIDLIFTAIPTPDTTTSATSDIIEELAKKLKESVVRDENAKEQESLAKLLKPKPDFQPNAKAS